MTRAILLDFETRPDPAMMDSPEYWGWYRSGLSPDGGLKDPVKIAEDMTRIEEGTLVPFLAYSLLIG